MQYPANETIEIAITDSYRIRKSVKSIISGRLRPRIWSWDYLGLNPLLRNIEKFSIKSKEEKKVNFLDAGCGVKPYRSLFPFAEKYVGFDSIKNSHVDFVGMLWNMPFDEDEFDAVICTQVLEHTMKFTEAVMEIKRVTKNNGLVYISVPLTFPEHEVPYDYFRFTRYGLKEIFKDFEIMELTPHNGYVSTLMRLWNVLLHYFPYSQIYFAPVFVLNNLIGIICDSAAKIFFSIMRRLTGNILFSEIYKKYYLGMTESYSLVLRVKK